MNFQLGDSVIINRVGSNSGRTGIIDKKTRIATQLTLPSADPVWFYTVTLSATGDAVIIDGRDLLKLDMHNMRSVGINKDKELVCVCGGDHLAIPHHYDWCPKGVSNDKNTKNETTGQNNRQVNR